MRVSDQLDMLSVHSLTAGALYTIIKLRSTVLHLLFTTEISLCYLYRAGTVFIKLLNVKLLSEMYKRTFTFTSTHTLEGLFQLLIQELDNQSVRKSIAVYLCDKYKATGSCELSVVQRLELSLW